MSLIFRLADITIDDQQIGDAENVEDEHEQIEDKFDFGFAPDQLDLSAIQNGPWIVQATSGHASGSVTVAVDVVDQQGQVHRQYGKFPAHQK